MDTFKVQQLFAWKESMALLNHVATTCQPLIAGRVQLMNSVYTSLAKYITAQGVTPTMVQQVTDTLPDVTKAFLSCEPSESMGEDQLPSLSMWLAPFYEKIRTQERQIQVSAASCLYAIVRNAPDEFFLPEAENMITELVNRLRRSGCAVHDTIYSCLTVALSHMTLHDSIRPHAETLIAVSVEALRNTDFHTRFAAAKFLTVLNVAFPNSCRTHNAAILAALERVRYDRNADVRNAVKECFRSFGKEAPSPGTSGAALSSISIGDGSRKRAGSSGGRNSAPGSPVMVNISNVTRARTSSNGGGPPPCLPTDAPSSMQPPKKKKPLPLDGHWAARLEINPQHVYRRLSLVEVEQMGMKETVEKYMAEKDAEIAQLRARVARLEEAVIRFLHEDDAGSGVKTPVAAATPDDKSVRRNRRRSLTTAESSAWVTAMRCVGETATSERGFTSFLDNCDVASASPHRRRELQTRLLRLMQVAGPERAASLSAATIQRMMCLLFADGTTVGTEAPAGAAAEPSPPPEPKTQEEEEGAEQQESGGALFNLEDFTATVMPWLEQLADQEKVMCVDDVRDPDTAARLRGYLESIVRQQPTNVFKNVADRILSSSSH